MPNNVVLSTLVLLLVINLIGFLYSYLIIKTDFFKQFKLQNRPHRIKDFYKRAPLICMNISILMLITGLGLYYFSDYIIKDFNSVWILIFEVVVVLIIDDIYFYLWHRLMHENKFLYKKIHKVHHRSITPFPSEYLYVHPVEWMVGMIGPFIGIVLLGGVSAYSFWMILIIRNIHELDIHSGLKSSYITRYFPFSGTNEHHDMHHAYLNGNYASAFSFWDRIFKTVIKGDRKFHKL